MENAEWTFTKGKSDGSDLPDWARMRRPNESSPEKVIANALQRLIDLGVPFGIGRPIAAAANPSYPLYIWIGEPGDDTRLEAATDDFVVDLPKMIDAYEGGLRRRDIPVGGQIL